ncbi:MAG: MBL fold metallo-hydrolase [Deltaproteobacteria bacterium]|nr:MBL fold metallo-hydrolase [Deltaproteobacteria bacterium]
MIRLTTLVENTASKGSLRAEHGLSVLVETGQEVMLFDTGQTDALLHNAEVLGMDLSRIGTVVLSHGHYDHAGGLPYLAALTKPVVYAHPEIFRKRYAQAVNQMRYIGIRDRTWYEKGGIRFILDEEPREVLLDVYTSGTVAMTTDFEKVDKNFVYQVGDRYEKDDVPDDLSLVLNTQKGLFIIFGCAHRGIINIITQAEGRFGRKVFGFIGGTHLGPADEIQKERTIKALKAMDLELIGPNHCTGALMAARLFGELGGVVVFNNVGSVVELV